MSKRVGAPKGGRVHWLLWHLPSDFKGAYRLVYSYARHNYIFYRMAGRQIYDVFVVIQTSKHYWHVTYANAKNQDYARFGYRNTRIIAEWMYDIYSNGSFCK